MRLNISYMIFTALFLLTAINHSAIAADPPTALSNQSTSLMSDSSSAFLNRRASLKRMGDPKYIDNSGQKTKSYDVVLGRLVKQM